MLAGLRDSQQSEGKTSKLGHQQVGVGVRPQAGQKVAQGLPGVPGVEVEAFAESQILDQSGTNCQHAKN